MGSWCRVGRAGGGSGVKIVFPSGIGGGDGEEGRTAGCVCTFSGRRSFFITWCSVRGLGNARFFFLDGRGG